MKTLHHVYLPAAMVKTGEGVPSLCARHGEPAVRRRIVNFESRPPDWAYLLLLVGVVPFFLVIHILRKTMIATGWPICARCRSGARWLRLGALGLLLTAVGIGSVGVAIYNRYPGFRSGVIDGCLLSLAACVFVFRQAAPSRITRAEVTPDGLALRVRHAAPAFAAALPAAPSLVGPPAPPPSWAAGPPRGDHPGW